VAVGGDVLKVHRFFLPVFSAAALVSTMALRLLGDKVPRKSRPLILFVISLCLLVLTYFLPRKEVEHFNFYERMFTKKMRTTARDMMAADSTNFSVALPTIGIFGYELLGHKIIVMVGLTDSTIARHSEPPVAGMKTTWKETKHNSRYILESAPDYILFSTGKKPSAPAERALLLYPQFLDSYRAIGWFYRAFETQSSGVFNPVFKKMRPITGEIKPTYPVAYVQYYKEALDYYVKGDNEKAIEYFDKALQVSPKPYYVYLLYQKAFSYMKLNRHSKAYPMLDALIKRDSLIVEAHRDLYMYAMLLGDTAKAAIHERWIKKLTPWYWPRIKGDVRRVLETARDNIVRKRHQKGS
jgi:hypothetical protein